VISRAVLALALAAIAAAPDAAYKKDVERVRAAHEADYRKEYVTLAGLVFLKQGQNRAGSAASNDVVLPASAPVSLGTFFLSGTHVRFEPRPGAPVTLGGRSVRAAVDLKSDGDADKPDELAVGAISMWVHDSGERRAVRIRDGHGEVARSFAGFHWFPIDERYRATGRFIKDPVAREVKIPTLAGDSATFTTEGVVEFALNGRTLRLRAMTTGPRQLYFIFRDATSGHETYEAARFLYADLREDGTAVVDFNAAYNPPCAFSPYTTCPLPPLENRLDVRIPAGEKDYPHHPAHPTP
jgi:uncharacterized protein (DUF1684 family)